jgi:hypothetical protein
MCSLIDRKGGAKGTASKASDGLPPPSHRLALRQVWGCFRPFFPYPGQRPEAARFKVNLFGPGHGKASLCGVQLAAGFTGRSPSLNGKPPVKRRDLGLS